MVRDRSPHWAVTSWVRAHFPWRVIPLISQGGSKCPLSRVQSYFIPLLVLKPYPKRYYLTTCIISEKGNISNYCILWLQCYTWHVNVIGSISNLLMPLPNVQWCDKLLSTAKRGDNVLGSVRLSVGHRSHGWIYGTQRSILGARLCRVQQRPKESHYQSNVFVCVSSNRADEVDWLLIYLFFRNTLLQKKFLQSKSKETHIKIRIILWPPWGSGAKNSHGRSCKWEFYTCSNFSATILKIF